MRMLWARAEPDGYAQHMTSDPYPNTPRHNVLLMSGYGDHQVSNYAAEVEARTVGARALKADMPRARGSSGARWGGGGGGGRRPRGGGSSRWTSRGPRRTRRSSPSGTAGRARR